MISCGDYVTNLQSLTVDLCTQRDVHFTARLQELELRNQQLQEQLSVYRDKCDTLSKENEFVRINMGNIVDARVTQRTSELLYQLDQFKKFTQDFSKDEYARSIQQKLDIHGMLLFTYTHDRSIRTPTCRVESVVECDAPKTLGLQDWVE